LGNSSLAIEKESIKFSSNRNTTMPSEIILSLANAFELCKLHREKNGVRMFSQCWGCVRFSKDDPEKMCFYKPPNNDGCKHVNKMFKVSNKQ
jgi:hypothetical protein